MDLQHVYQDCTQDGNFIHPPTWRLDPKDYAAFKKTMTDNGGVWKGGKKQAFLFSYDPAELLSRLQGGESINMKKDFDFFESPQNVVDFIDEICDYEVGLKVLEPSAGSGALAGMFDKDDVHCIELNQVMRVKLLEDGFKVVWDDFLTYQEKASYDLVVGNPPFKGWFDHFYKMVDVCKPGGVVVCVGPSGLNFRNDRKHNEWREFFNSFNRSWIWDLEEGSFKESGTMVNTVVVKLIKE